MKITRYLYFFMIIIACFFVFQSQILSGDSGDSPSKSEDTQINENQKTPVDDTEAAPNHDLTETEEETQQQSETLTPIPSRGKYVSWDESLIKTLSFLQSPLPGAQVTTRDSQLPGAPRTYRNGTHEGLDFYSGYCGIPINFGDPVFSAGPGVIYRIDHDYIEALMEERNELLKISHKLDDTPEEILDMLRGRQVWIIHPFGVITRYAHLDNVAEDLQEGDLVEAGDFIGTIGNSGTSDGANGSTLNPHLHWEIWIGESYLGEGLPPSESRALLQIILNQ
ncbi:MAG: M23 family metallopeptidase [Bacillota bacterium]|nr:M23 family metallopeptidase [Bacillota bacterium]